MIRVSGLKGGLENDQQAQAREGMLIGDLHAGRWWRQQGCSWVRKPSKATEYATEEEANHHLSRLNGLISSSRLRPNFLSGRPLQVVPRQLALSNLHVVPRSNPVPEPTDSFLEEPDQPAPSHEQPVEGKVTSNGKRWPTPAPTLPPMVLIDPGTGLVWTSRPRNTFTCDVDEGQTYELVSGATRAMTLFEKKHRHRRDISEMISKEPLAIVNKAIAKEIIREIGKRRAVNDLRPVKVLNYDRIQLDDKQLAASTGQATALTSQPVASGQTMPVLSQATANIAESLDPDTLGVLVIVRQKRLRRAEIQAQIATIIKQKEDLELEQMQLDEDIESAKKSLFDRI